MSKWKPTGNYQSFSHAVKTPPTASRKLGTSTSGCVGFQQGYLPHGTLPGVKVHHFNLIALQLPRLHLHGKHRISTSSHHWKFEALDHASERSYGDDQTAGGACRVEGLKWKRDLGTQGDRNLVVFVQHVIAVAACISWPAHSPSSSVRRRSTTARGEVNSEAGNTLGTLSVVASVTILPGRNGRVHGQISRRPASPGASIPQVRLLLVRERAFDAGGKCDAKYSD